MIDAENRTINTFITRVLRCTVLRIIYDLYEIHDFLVLYDFYVCAGHDLYDTFGIHGVYGV